MLSAISGIHCKLESIYNDVTALEISVFTIQSIAAETAVFPRENILCVSRRAPNVRRRGAPRCAVVAAVIPAAVAAVIPAVAAAVIPAAIQQSCVLRALLAGWHRTAPHRAHKTLHAGDGRRFRSLCWIGV